MRALRESRTIAIAFGVLTLLSVALLLGRDAWPRPLPAPAHDVLATLPLVLIVVAYVVHQGSRRVNAKEWARTALLASAFLFWAANQLLSNPHLATLCNDLAIGAFVVDVFLVVIGRPATLPDLR
jgi:hypothetical protein